MKQTMHNTRVRWVLGIFIALTLAFIWSNSMQSRAVSGGTGMYKAVQRAEDHDTSFGNDLGSGFYVPKDHNTGVGFYHLRFAQRSFIELPIPGSPHRKRAF